MDVIGDFFNSISSIVDFIVSIFNTIVDGINGCISIIQSIINLVGSIIKILPNDLYTCLLFFVSVYLVVIIYKVLRKG